MIPYKAHRPTAVPKTLETRLEIMKAIRTLAARHEDEQLRQRRADIVALRRDCEQVAQSLRELWREWQPRARSYVLKYNPDESRVPAGNPDGGQWTSEGGSAAGTRLADASEGPSSSQPGQVISDAKPGVQVAAGTGRSGYPIDLQEEEQRGGHTIEEHVGKSAEYLLSRLRDEVLRIQTLGDTAQGLTAQGSFPSLEAANKLVNATVAKNQDTVEMVATGALLGAQFDADFPSPTGYEAYARTERSQPYIRETYGVHVVIVHDRNSANGYRVFTAFPVNR